MMQRDLFRKDYHAIFVRRDGSKSDVLMFDGKEDMSKTVNSKLKLDRELYAYATLNWWNGQKVQQLELRMCNTDGAK